VAGVETWQIITIVVILLAMLLTLRIFARRDRR
jgi:hypothetical protein